MKLRYLVPGLIFAFCPWAYAATTTTYPQWTGVWRGALDAQPGVILTLADDEGELSGTVVFNVVIRENGEARVAGADVHAVRHPQLSGTAMEFHVVRHGDGRDLLMKVQLNGDGKARIQCQNCEPDSPAAELVRDR